jgi:hypothetical protein
MRKRKQAKGITINAIAGTYVVFLGLNIEAAARKGFRGFAIQRQDHAEDELTWARGMKTFEATEPTPEQGETFSTLKHPWQGFQWADYSAKPGHRYTYTVHAMYGKPDALESRRQAAVEITTESELGGVHSVFFNRGAVATQEYARRFLNKPPEKAGPGAYEWLSRGLAESIIAFVDEAKKGDSLHAAIYEFQWSEVLEAFKRANSRGVKVTVIFDDVENYDKEKKPTGPWTPNRTQIKAMGIGKICSGRANAKLMHNKFIVHSKGKKPVRVLTGSTNITLNGIYGHSNLAHIVEDPNIAIGFKAYWDRLKKDLKIDNAYRDENVEAFMIPAKFARGTYAIFSPRRTNLDVLDWYAQIAGSAGDALFMTFAFGMHEKFKNVYRQQDEILRMALMEKTFASGTVKDRDEKDIRAIRKLPNVVVAVGNRIVTNAFDRWLDEMRSVDGKGKHVYWIHTKYMIVDPLGKDPIVVSGSANFSKASTDTNDENMLVIKGDKRIADIYFGEYMRLYTHYAFREAVQRALEREKAGNPSDWRPQFLETSDDWMRPYFTKSDPSARYSRRIYFAGPMST